MHDDSQTYSAATVELGTEEERPLVEELEASLQALQGFAKRPDDFDPSSIAQITDVVKGCLELLEVMRKGIEPPRRRGRCPTYERARRQRS